MTVTAVDNATDAPDKQVTVSGSASNTQGVTDPSDVTLTIADDDAAPTAALSVASSSIPENGGSTTVSAALSHPSSAATTVMVTPVSGLYTGGVRVRGATIVNLGGIDDERGHGDDHRGGRRHRQCWRPLGDGDRHGGQRPGGG